MLQNGYNKMGGTQVRLISIVRTTVKIISSFVKWVQYYLHLRIKIMLVKCSAQYLVERKY